MSDKNTAELDANDAHKRLYLRGLDSIMGIMHKQLDKADYLRSQYIKPSDPTFKDMYYSVKQFDSSLTIGMRFLCDLREYVRRELLLMDGGDDEEV